MPHDRAAAVRLFPLYHPAAALYTRSLLDILRADFARIPELLALALEPPRPSPSRPAVPRRSCPSPSELVRGSVVGDAAARRAAARHQLGLF